MNALETNRRSQRPKARAIPGRRGASGWWFVTGLLLLAGSGCLFSAEPKVVEPPDLSPAVVTLPDVGVSARAQAATGRLGMNAGEPGPREIETRPTTNTMGSLDDSHGLAIGDRISFRIEEDAEDPKSLVVTDSGDLEVPYLGRFPAEGKTCRQLAVQVKAALEKDYYYQATVIIAVDQMTKTRGRVYLVGPVRVPGPQQIPGDEILTLSKAIMRAGGFDEYADRHNVKVTRKARSDGRDKKTFVVDVGLIFDKGKVELDLVLEPDDLILIPERLIRF